MEFWINPISYSAYSFLIHFKEQLKQFGNKVTFKPLYKFKNLKEKFDEKFLKKHCFGKGEFCQTDSKLDPKSILEEGIR